MPNCSFVQFRQERDKQHSLLGGQHWSKVQIYTSFRLQGGETEEGGGAEEKREAFELISCESIWSGWGGDWPPEAVWGSMCQQALIRNCPSLFPDQENTLLKYTELFACLSRCHCIQVGIDSKPWLPQSAFLKVNKQLSELSAKDRVEIKRATREEVQFPWCIQDVHALTGG